MYIMFSIYIYIYIYSSACEQVAGLVPDEVLVIVSFFHFYYQ